MSVVHMGCRWRCQIAQPMHQALSAAHAANTAGFSLPSAQRTAVTIVCRCIRTHSIHSSEVAECELQVFSSAGAHSGLQGQPHDGDGAGQQRQVECLPGARLPVPPARACRSEPLAAGRGPCCRGRCLHAYAPHYQVGASAMVDDKGSQQLHVKLQLGMVTAIQSGDGGLCFPRSLRKACKGGCQAA